jgi:hypothetical protein
LDDFLDHKHFIREWQHLHLVSLLLLLALTLALALALVLVLALVLYNRSHQQRAQLRQLH